MTINLSNSRISEDAVDSRCKINPTEVIGFDLPVSSFVCGGTFFSGGETVSEEVLKQKEAVVKEIEDKIKNSTAMVLLEYKGLTVEEANDLRNKYRNENVEYKVYKNTLMKKAFSNLGIEGFDEYLSGPNALAFSMGELTSSAKISREYSKDNEKLVIKAGYVNGDFLDVEGVKKLADIPPMDVLYGKLLGSIKSPVSNFVMLMGGLHNQVAKFAYIVKEVAKMKEEGKLNTAEEVKETEE